MSEARRLRREEKAAEIIKSIKGDRWRRKPPKPVLIEVTTPDPDQFVYFLYSAGLIKIGYTADIFKRIADIKSMGGAHAELIALAPGNRQFEKTLHRLFKPDRQHGEWFKPSTEIRRFLACLDVTNAATMTPDAAAAIGSCVARLEIAEKTI